MADSRHGCNHRLEHRSAILVAGWFWEATAGAARRGPSLGPAIIAATGAGGSRARFGLLEFGQRGKHAEDRLTDRRCGVDAGAVPGQHLKTNATCCEVMRRVDQMTTQITVKPGQLLNETDRGPKE
jgi:hypothetical protein